VTNNGAGAAQNVVLSGTVQAGATAVSIDGGAATCEITGSTLRCRVAELANGASETIDLTVTSATAGAYDVSASIAAYADDADPTNNTALATLTVTAADADGGSGGDGGCGCTMTTGHAPFDPMLLQAMRSAEGTAALLL